MLKFCFIINDNNHSGFIEIEELHDLITVSYLGSHENPPQLFETPYRQDIESTMIFQLLCLRFERFVSLLGGRARFRF